MQLQVNGLSDLVRDATMRWDTPSRRQSRAILAAVAVVWLTGLTVVAGIGVLLAAGGPR